MRVEFMDLLVEQHDEPPEQNPWEWNRDNVDFSRVPNYDTPRHEPYDPDFMPWWKEPQEKAVDPATREIWILKDERSGCSENIALNLIRYKIAVDPESILYLSGDQALTEGFFSKRVKRGMGLSDVLADRYAQAERREHTVDFGNMDLDVRWPKAKGAFKSDGYPLVIGDEVSLWQEGGPEGMRGRTGSYNFSTVIGISSLDAEQKRKTEDDPIWVEFNKGDMRYWVMPDPKTGHYFRFVFGSPDSPFGLKWSPEARRGNGSWDFEKVRKTAHYVTPDGTIIKNLNRLKVARSGKWQRTNRDAAGGIFSYHMNVFCSPFQRGDFGEIAVSYIVAKSKGKTYQRKWIYNNLADEWKDDVERAPEEVIKLRRLKYERGQLLSECQQKAVGGKRYADIYIQRDTRIYMTVDVQKDYQPLVIREWIDNGDSGLVYWDNATSWNQVEELAETYHVDYHGVDYHYKGRRVETLMYCEETSGFPLLGSDTLDLYYMKKMIDPREGVKGQGRNSIASYTWNTGVFRSILLEMLNGTSPQNWYTYYRQEHTYVRQVSSTECVGGKWDTRPGYGQDHLFDCEAMQLVLAAIDNFYVFDWSFMADDDKNE